MVKKFFSAIMLAFAFLFLNLGLNSTSVKSAQDLPENIFANAGIGEKLGYWAIVNYGADGHLSGRGICSLPQLDAALCSEQLLIYRTLTIHTA